MVDSIVRLLSELDEGHFAFAHRQEDLSQEVVVGVVAHWELLSDQAPLVQIDELAIIVASLMLVVDSVVQGGWRPRAPGKDQLRNRVRNLLGSDDRQVIKADELIVRASLLRGNPVGELVCSGYLLTQNLIILR